MRHRATTRGGIIRVGYIIIIITAAATAVMLGPVVSRHNIAAVFAEERVAGAAAGRTAPEAARLEYIVEQALRDNPEILALKEKAEAAKSRVTAAGAWDYPKLGYEKSDRQEMVSASQMFPFPGKRGAAAGAAKHEAKAADEELRLKIREVAAEVKKNYWRWWLAEKTSDIYKENLDIMTRFLNIAKTRYAVGNVTQVDVLKANTELAGMETMLLMLEKDKVSAAAAVNSLMGGTARANLAQKPVRPDIRRTKLSPAELTDIALKNNPEISAKESMYARNSAELALSKLQWFPDIEAGVKSSDMGERTYMIQSEIPLYFRKQGALAAAAGRQKEMAARELLQTAVSVERDIRDLWARYDAHIKTADIYETTIVPLAEQTLAVAEAGYRAGKNSFLDLLDSQKNYLSRSVDYYEHLAESQIYLIELEKTAGIDF